MTPITNVEKLINAAGGTLTNVFAALADGKISFTEVMQIFGTLMPFAGVDYKAVKDEFTGADAEAKASIVETINAAITLENKATEHKAEAVLAMLVYSGALFEHNVAE